MPADLSNEEVEMEREHMVFAMMATDSLGNAIIADAPEANRRLLSYRTAVRANAKREERATLLASLIEKVEGERLTDDTGHPTDIGYNAAISDILTLLRTEAETDAP